MAKRGYHHGNLRQALVDSALVLIEEKGPTGFTLSEAAKRAGVTPAAGWGRRRAVRCGPAARPGRPPMPGGAHMADVNRGNRPLSPHLQVYRPQLTSVTSILTRITGNALIVAILMIVWWFIAAASGPEAFATADGFVTSWFGDLVMFLSLWALWYHFLAGIRHLVWDSARMLELETAEKLGWAVVGGSVVLTVLTALIV